MQEAAARQPETERLELGLMDKARIGQKGRVADGCYQKGTRPRGLHEHSFASPPCSVPSARHATPAWACSCPSSLLQP